MGGSHHEGQKQSSVRHGACERPALRFAAASLAGALVACGGQANEPVDAGVVITSDGSAITGDGSAAPDSNVGLGEGGVSPDGGEPPGPRFSISVPGVAESIEGSLASAGSEHIRIEAYPELVHTKVGHGVLPLSFEGAFSEAFCSDVEELAMLASEGSALSANAHKKVRADGALTAHLMLYPFVGPSFETAAREAARAQGASSGSLLIENALALEEASLALVLEPDAITHHIGEVATLESSMNDELAAHEATALQSGSLQLPLSAKDLWCDLARERATLVFRTKGKVAGRSFMGESRARQVEALADRQ